MEPLSIQYHFSFSDDKLEIFHLRIDAQSLELMGNAPQNPPAWTRLDFHQCPNCPLDSRAHASCPLSLALVDIVTRFDKVLSYDQVRVSVISNNRRVCLDTSAQAGMSSLMGLVSAVSGCPHTVFFRPMARFHQPVPDEEETLYRAASMFLLAQYYLQKQGKEAAFDFEGLNRIYNNIQLVNHGMAERLKHASSGDLSANAITKLDLYAKIIPYFVQDKLDNIQYLFTPFLKDYQKIYGAHPKEE